jgi:hypothetical protein
MNDYEVRVYNHYQELVYRSLPSSLNFAISKVADYSKDESNSIYINNTHTGENYDYICGNKSTKLKTVKELNSEFEMKRKKCNDEIENLVTLIEKYKQDAEMNTQYSKIRMDLEYNLKMKLIEYTNYSY